MVDWVRHILTTWGARSPRAALVLGEARHLARRLESAARRRVPEALGGAYRRDRVQLRVLEPEDAPAFGEITQRQAGRTRLPSRAVPTSSEHGFTLGAFVHGALRGYANGIHVELPDGTFAVLIAPIYVDAAQRRRQLGRSLLAASLETAHSRGAEQVFAWVHPNNRASQAIFRALRFHPHSADDMPHLFTAGPGRPTPRHSLWWRATDGLTRRGDEG